LIDRLIGWEVGWLVEGLINWLVDLLIPVHKQTPTPCSALAKVGKSVLQFEKVSHSGLGWLSETRDITPLTHH